MGNVVWLVAIALFFMFGEAGAGINGVRYTKHNLGSGRTEPGTFQAAAGQTSEVCKFCHIPHNGHAVKKFLWNNDSYPTSEVFQMYTATDFIPVGQKGNSLSQVSRLCMSCHDGAGAINAMANGADPVMIDGYDQIADVLWSDPGPPAWEPGANIGGSVDGSARGTNLTNDHPVSIDYDAVYTYLGGAGLKTKAYAESQGVLFWDGRVECVSCHDPHVNGNGAAGGNPALEKFLRRSNTSSNLCFACHDK